MARTSNEVTIVNTVGQTTEPTAPVMLNATAVSGGVQLTWTSSDQTASTVDVFYNGGGTLAPTNKLTTLTGWTGSYLVPNSGFSALSAGTTYKFKVVVNN